jgi:hypothetical protein
MVLMVEYGPEALGDGRRPRRKEEFDWLNWLERKMLNGFDWFHWLDWFGEANGRLPTAPPSRLHRPFAFIQQK